MSCTNCGTQKKGGCSKLSCDNCFDSSSYDWLSDISAYTPWTPYLELVFKNDRKEHGKIIEENKNYYPGDIVVVENKGGGIDIGRVKYAGEIARVSYRSVMHLEDNKPLDVIRKANNKDIETWKKYQDIERVNYLKIKEIVQTHNLDMKISDIEYQADGSKLTIYYTSESRIDFRELVKKLASLFKTKIEMKQIGGRQEAGMLKGIGSCGRELCCATWLKDFRTVNTNAVRYQQLSLNPSKITGQCGKLKCCLNYELDLYVKAIKKFPPKEKVLKTKKGDAIFQKMNILTEEMWYSYKANFSNWYKMNLDIVQKIISMNEKNQIPENLEDFEIKKVEEEVKFIQEEKKLSVAKTGKKRRHKKPPRK